MRGDSDAYQTVPRAIGVMPKTYEAGATTGWHSHPRAQLLYATAGLTLVTAEDGFCPHSMRSGFRRSFSMK